MRRIGKRIVALVLALVLALSTFMVQAAAASTIKSKRTYKNFVYIGDSIAAGACMNGILKENPYDPLNVLMNGDRVVEGSWPQLVRDAIGAKSTYKMAREGWTVKNVLRLLDPSYEEELTYPANYYDRLETEITFSFNEVFYHEVDDMRTEAPEAVKNADVIAIEIGNNDTFSMVLFSYWFHYMYWTLGIPAEAIMTMMKDQFHPVESLEDVIAMYGVSDIKDLLTMIDEAVAEYEQNYDRLIKAIRALNPDCEIYVLGMYNIFEQAEPEGMWLRDFLAERNKAQIDELADYYTNRSAYKDEVTYVDISKTEIWWTFPMYTPLYYMSMMICTHPDYEGHQYIANQVIRAMNKNAKSAKKS